MNNNNNNSVDVQHRPGLLGAWLRGASALEHFLQDRFERVGFMVGKRPLTTIAIVLVISFVGILGLSQLSIVAKGDRLWTPQDSIPIAHREYVRSVQTFGAPPRLEEIILQTRSLSPASNLLSIAAIDEMMNLWASLKALQVSRGPGLEPDNVETLCVRKTLPTGAKGPCILLDSVIDFWSANATTFHTQVSSSAQLLSAVSASVLPDGRTVNRVNMFGKLEMDGSGNAVSAQALNLNFLLNQELEDRGKTWESAALDLLQAKRDALMETNSPFVLNFRFQRSMDDELLRSVSGDIPLLVATYTLMSVFVCLTLGKLHRVKGRVTLSLGGIVMIVVATLASFGFCSWAGVPFISLHQILPFILVGIGVDDMYIIVAAFNLTNKKWDIPRRLAYALRQIGVTITVTSLTNAMAFALGSTSSIPAITYFCQYASFSIILIYAFGMLAFSAILVLDEARQQAHRLDGCLCCFTSKVSQEEASQEEAARQAKQEERKAQELELGVLSAKAASPALVGNTSTDTDLIRVLDEDGTVVVVQPKPEDLEHERSVTESWNPNMPSKHLSWSARFMRDTYAPWLMNPKVKVLVLVAFFGFLALNVYWVTQVTEGFELVDITPDDSYVRDFFESEDEFFAKKQLALTLYFRALPYHTAETQQAIQSFTDRMLANHWTSGPVISWLAVFQQFYRTTSPYNSNLDASSLLTDKALFYQALDQFLQLPQNLIFNSNVHWSDATRTEITASRISLFHVPLTTSEQQKNMLLELRSLALSSPLNEGFGGKDAMAFPYSPYYVFFESYVSIYKELLLNFCLSGVAVICICLVLLVHPGAIPFLVIVIAMIDLDLLGAIHMWGLQINSVTVVQLVMATGLIVDYSAHVTEAFLLHTGSRDERVSKALASMGSSIIMGGTTSFLGVCPLVFSNSTIFRTFFRMFFCIVVYGIFHGLMLLPVLLSYWGPELVEHEDPTDKLEEEKAAAMGKTTYKTSSTTDVMSARPVEQQAPSPEDNVEV